MKAIETSEAIEKLSDIQISERLKYLFDLERKIYKFRHRFDKSYLNKIGKVIWNEIGKYEDEWEVRGMDDLVSEITFYSYINTQ